MLSINIHNAKTHLSQYIAKALEGEEVIICKNGHPLVILKPYKKNKSQRTFGCWAGKVHMADDFDELPDEWMGHFK